MHNIRKDGHCEYFKMQDSLFKHTRLGTHILGPCNGLFLMRSYDANCFPIFWLWNPYNKESKEIVIPKVRDTDVYGLCYKCDTDDYVIVVATFYSSLIGYKVQVYTLRSNSWRTLPNILPYNISSVYGVEAIFVHGAIHWIASQIVSPFPSRKTCIVSYDIRGENFNEVALTPRVDELLNGLNCNEQNSLSVFGGCLCILRPYGGYNIEVWVKKSYNVRESWTILFIAQLPVVTNPIHRVKILWEFKNGEVLLVASKGSPPWNCCFVLYDWVSQKCKVTEIDHIIAFR
ncbi:F-box protein CPR1-like [Papaver somniferum]|uniref:F-box protein CPR1-like n=1 Tax=Papaver somniferum TaxID=3469 RepID=UPI000E7016D9|nr:F-box protein CPR1-like [Papaver somniferum]